MKQKLTCDLAVGDTIQTSAGFDETIKGLSSTSSGFRLARFHDLVPGQMIRALWLPPETLWDLVENKS